MARRPILLPICLMLALGLAACTPAPEAEVARAATPAIPLHPNETPELRSLINEYAELYDLPRTLLHRVIIRESTHRPWARNGPYYGLMQILPATARSMGFRGQATDLLDAETNLKYAGKYLRGAWMLANGDEARAVQLYARGYWDVAKAAGMLEETGLKPATASGT